ncbi:hypothetical protein [Legionella sp. W05-934-2]|uniref:hypothetical protein n=1 Tax=Legionella sp. W05-934-2 TaxID=1198649 RepID=UPI00346294B6
MDPLGEDFNDSPTFWESLIGFDLTNACQDLESTLKNNTRTLLGQVNKEASSTYTSRRFLSSELFSHHHLPLYQQLNSQLSRLGTLINSLSRSNSPLPILLLFEKEYQALTLFLQRKEFLGVYQKNQADYESCRIEMVQWHNKIVLENGDDQLNYNLRLSELKRVKSRAIAQRLSLVAILYQTKADYENYLSSRYTNKALINQKWQAYFGDVVWLERKNDIGDAKGKTLSTQALWQKIESIFLLAKRPMFHKDSPIKDMLIKFIQRYQSDSGIDCQPQSNKYQLTSDYELVFKEMVSHHIELIEKLKPLPTYQSVVEQFKEYQKQASLLNQKVHVDEEKLVDLVGTRIDGLIKKAGTMIAMPKSVIAKSPLLVSSVLNHLFHYYPEIVSYLDGIASTIHCKLNDRGNLVDAQPTSKTASAILTLMKLISTHKLRVSALEKNDLLPNKDYPIHLEKIAFFEALHEFNQQQALLVTKDSSPQFFSRNNLPQQFLALVFQLTQSNLDRIDETIDHLRTVYRLTHQAPRQEQHIENAATSYPLI